MAYCLFITLSVISEISDKDLYNILLHCMHLGTLDVQNF